VEIPGRAVEFRPHVNQVSVAAGVNSFKPGVSVIWVCGSSVDAVAMSGTAAPTAASITTPTTHRFDCLTPSS
jgi:hypothetical protein